MSHANQALRAIPSVSAILAHPQVAHLSSLVDAAILTQLAREAQQRARERAMCGSDVSIDAVVEEVASLAEQLLAPAPRRVINGTGVVIQTNLGRSPVSRRAAEAMRDVAAGYVALEIHLETGERGGRGKTIEQQLRALTGAEATLVVNNNAAAVYLVLATLCHGREVIVSRGEAVEIGGGFRVPDVLRRSGAVMVEVGATNRTYASDYADAITADTAALLKVHRSNFSVIGFTASASLDELAALANERGTALIEDAGSGCLLATEAFGLSHEPTLQESIVAGVDVVCASGDKLLGGPQAGLIIGKKRHVDAIRRHPMARALRADKTCLAGLAATLAHYIEGRATEDIPVWWSMSRTPDWARQRCERWKSALGEVADIVPSECAVGGGSLPGQTLPSWAIALTCDIPADRLAQNLRLGATPVIPRVVDGRVTIDARTVLPVEDDELVGAIRSALGGAA